MKFGIIFETHKIPEWYEHYLDYKKLKKLIKANKKGIKAGTRRKLNGLYRVTKKFVVYRADLFDRSDENRARAMSRAQSLIDKPLAIFGDVDSDDDDDEKKLIIQSGQEKYDRGHFSLLIGVENLEKD